MLVASVRARTLETQKEFAGKFSTSIMDPDEVTMTALVPTHSTKSDIHCVKEVLK